MRVGELESPLLYDSLLLCVRTHCISNRIMRVLWLASAIFFSLSSFASAQTSNSAPSTAILPPCALACQNLIKAQSTCSPSTPGAVLQTNTTTYRECLCHNNLVTPLVKSPNGVCDSECPVQKDRDILQNWFIAYCKDGSKSTAASTASTVSTSSIPPSSTLTSELSSSTSHAAAAAETSSSPARPKRRNGLSKKATIGIAVGISVAMIVVAAAVYFPLLRAAGRAMRAGTPMPAEEKEAGMGENVVTKNMTPRNDEEDVVGRVRVITAFKQ